MRIKGTILIRKFSELTLISDCREELCEWLGFDYSQRFTLKNIDGNYMRIADISHEVWCCSIKTTTWYGETLGEVVKKFTDEG